MGLLWTCGPVGVSIATRYSYATLMCPNSTIYVFSEIARSVSWGGVGTITAVIEQAFAASS